MTYYSYRSMLNSWLTTCEVHDEHGQPVHLTPHQWRHTFACRLINRDVPQEVVRVLLDHESTQMTAHYARITDQTVRRRWEQATKVNIKGERVAIDPEGPLAQAQWAKTRYGMATQTLPNGYCGLPLQRTCPHANACLTCPVFLTGPEFLPELREQQRRTLTLIDVSERGGQARMVEMNQQVLTNLDRMISEVEKTATESRTPACELTTPTTSSQRPDAELPPHGAEPSRHCAGWTMRDKRFRSMRWRGKARSPGPGSTTNPTCAPRSNDSVPGRNPAPARQRLPDRQRASDASLRRRLEVMAERNRQLDTENRQLREALAVALGEQRTASIVGRPGDTPRNEIATSHRTLLTTASATLTTTYPSRSTGRATTELKITEGMCASGPSMRSAKVVSMIANARQALSAGRAPWTIVETETASSAQQPGCSTARR